MFAFLTNLWSKKDPHKEYMKALQAYYKLGPPIELYKQYFSTLNYNSKAKPLDELIALDIEIISLVDSNAYYIDDSMKYVAKFLSNFCVGSVNYNELSNDGREKIDSIYTCKEISIQKAIQVSGCIATQNEGDDL